MPKFYEGYADKIEVPTGKRDVLVFDSELRGFGIRQFASRAAYYIVKYSVAGITRRQSLGEVTRGNLKQMRLLASEVKARARLGQDVIAEKQAAMAKNAEILGPVIEEYLRARKDLICASKSWIARSRSPFKK